MSGDAIRECREILGESACGDGADSMLAERCRGMLDVLALAAVGLCEKARGEQTPVSKFELLTGTDALFRGVEAEHRTARAAVPEVDQVMKKVSALRKSPGFRKLLGDVLHGVLVEQEVDWVMVPLLRELVECLEEMRELVE